MKGTTRRQGQQVASRDYGVRGLDPKGITYDPMQVFSCNFFKRRFLKYIH